MRYRVILNQKWISILQLVPGVFRVPGSPGTYQKRVSQRFAESRGFSPGGPVSSRGVVDRVG